MKWYILLSCWAAVPFLVMGCTTSNESSGVLPSSQYRPAEMKVDSGRAGTRGPGSSGVVGVSVLTTTNPFFNDISDNLTAELAKSGYRTIVVSGEFDVARQRDQVNDFIAKRVAAIVLCPCDSKGIGSVIQQANRAGIPVFTCDIASLSSEGKVESHIATDNLSGGRLAGEAMIEALGESGGTVVILDYRSAESCLLRVQGFKEVIAKHNENRTSGKIDIVAELPGEGKTDLGYKATEDALQAHADLAGIFAINDPSGLGAYAALEKARKTDQVKIIAFDGQKPGKEAIRDGKIYADPVQFPDQIGIRTAQSILKYFAGEEVPKEQLIPTKLYRQADGLADQELRKSD